MMVRSIAINYGDGEGQVVMSGRFSESEWDQLQDVIGRDVRIVVARPRRSRWWRRG